MEKFKTPHVPSSEITPEHVYLNRRKFMKTSAIFAAASLVAACSPNTSNSSTTETGAEIDTELKTVGQADELGGTLNTYEQITNYNNFYEFSFDKEMVAVKAKNFPISPWEIKVGGLVNKPRTFTIDDLLKQFPSEERIYRLRCVEAWSMVIPWMGFPLKELLKSVEPTGSAKYVAFKTALDEENMPNLVSLYPWPYTEGLRLDEAMHDLTLMVTGLYGKPIPPQNGAPLRLAVPWKYGFKSIKSIVAIDLVEEMPKTLWSTIAPDEYGFFANVNPDISHPRWSQATERRIGETARRATLLFNGYAEQVSSLYSEEELKGRKIYY